MKCEGQGLYFLNNSASDRRSILIMGLAMEVVTYRILYFLGKGSGVMAIFRVMVQILFGYGDRNVNINDNLIVDMNLTHGATAQSTISGLILILKMQ